MSPAKFPPGTHSATFANNTLGLAIADVVLQRYAKWKTITSDMKQVEKNLNDVISAVAKQSPLVKSGYAIGALGRIFLHENIAGSIDDLAMTVARKEPVGGYHGAILASTGLSPHILAFNPSLTITKQELEILKILLLRTFKKAEKRYE